MATNIIYTRPYTGGPYYSLPVPGIYPPRRVRLPVNGTSIATIPSYHHPYYAAAASAATAMTTTTTTTSYCPAAAPLVYYPGTASYGCPPPRLYYQYAVGHHR